MRGGLVWAGAALQIVVFQLIVWALQAGQRREALLLGGAAGLLAIGSLLVYRRNVTEG